MLQSVGVLLDGKGEEVAVVVKVLDSLVALLNRSEHQATASSSGLGESTEGLPVALYSGKGDWVILYAGSAARDVHLVFAHCSQDLLICERVCVGDKVPWLGGRRRRKTGF
ncbi:MAG: hypothetical protein ACJARS_002963 [bacterium]